ncbi:MAG: hypothetical protein ABSA17_02145 [Rhabdochlamydiaceae bacterium]|jgi:uncharacterized protein YggL (DUF469 family)
MMIYRFPFNAVPVLSHTMAYFSPHDNSSRHHDHQSSILTSLGLITTAVCVSLYRRSWTILTLGAASSYLSYKVFQHIIAKKENLEGVHQLSLRTSFLDKVNKITPNNWIEEQMGGGYREWEEYVCLVKIYHHFPESHRKEINEKQSEIKNRYQALKEQYSKTLQVNRSIDQLKLPTADSSNADLVPYYRKVAEQKESLKALREKLKQFHNEEWQEGKTLLEDLSFLESQVTEMIRERSGSELEALRKRYQEQLSVLGSKPQDLLKTPNQAEKLDDLMLELQQHITLFNNKFQQFVHITILDIFPDFDSWKLSLNAYRKIRLPVLLADQLASYRENCNQKSLELLISPAFCLPSNVEIRQFVLPRSSSGLTCFCDRQCVPVIKQLIADIEQEWGHYKHHMAILYSCYEINFTSINSIEEFFPQLELYREVITLIAEKYEEFDKQVQYFKKNAAGRQRLERAFPKAFPPVPESMSRLIDYVVENHPSEMDFSKFTRGQQYEFHRFVSDLTGHVVKYRRDLNTPDLQRLIRLEKSLPDSVRGKVSVMYDEIRASTRGSGSIFQ